MYMWFPRTCGLLVDPKSHESLLNEKPGSDRHSMRGVTDTYRGKMEHTHEYYSIREFSSVDGVLWSVTVLNVWGGSRKDRVETEGTTVDQWKDLERE